MDCVRSNQMNWVDCLYWLRYRPLEIKGNNYQYSCPFMHENEVRFNVNRKKNVWRDLGMGKSGNVPNFVVQFFSCDAKIAGEIFSSFDQQKGFELVIKKALIKSVEMNTEDAIGLIAAKQTITDPFRCNFLNKKEIPNRIANKCGSDASFEFNHRIYTAAGFKNKVSAYELKSEFFESHISSERVTYLNNNRMKSAAVFENFLDFLSYQIPHKNQLQLLTNFLVLNSFDFF